MTTETAADSTPAARAVETDPKTGGGRVRRLVGYSVLVYCCSRLLTLAAASVLTYVRPELGVVRVLASTWDGGLYQAVVTEGYPDSGPSDDPRGLAGTAAFFPLYPMLIRIVVRLLDVSIPIASLLVSLTFGALAVVLVALVARLVAGNTVARRTATLFSFGPGAFVFSLAYSEGVMITFAAACLFCLLRRQWFLAGVAGALATAARPNAVVVVACCGWAAWRAVGKDGDRDWRALAAPILAPLGGLAFLGFLYLRTGEPTYWFMVQREVWHDRIDFGVNSAQRLVALVADPLATPNRVLFGLSVLLAIALLAILVRAGLPAELNLFACGIIFLAAMSSVLYPTPRFLLTAFPLTIALALRLRPPAYRLVLAASAAAMPALLVFYAIGSADQGDFPLQYFVAP